MRRAMWGSALLLGFAIIAAPSGVAAPDAEHANAAAVAAYWDAAHRAAALPRDLIVDERGLSHLRGRDGTLQPYGTGVAIKGKPSGGTTAKTVANAEWKTGGAIATATGRLYFRMKDETGQPAGWVCSGTAIADAMTGASLILTAAHCVYDDVNGEFATYALFIPNHAVTTTAYGEDVCPTNPLGCWVPSFGVVDDNWTTTVWPNNIAWDYGFYVVPTSGAHIGSGAQPSLELAAGTMAANFDTAPTTGTYTHAFGYSYAYDPKLMYCAQGLGTVGSVNWWLSKCRLSGGASGGPWLQPFANAAGTVVSVNSWGYTNAAGMAGPKLNSATARCVRQVAESGAVPTTVPHGVVAACAG